jgi:hypothetical protein
MTSDPTSVNPYRSPATQFNANPYSYKPFFGLLLAIKIAAILTTVLSVVVTAIELAGLASLGDIAPEVRAETLSVYDIASGLLALGLIPMNLIWNILYLVATYRATANAHVLGNPRPQTSAGFAVGSYFIPILNLFKPFQAMKECYAACRVDAGALLGWWWGTHIGCMVLTQISTRLTLNSMRSDPASAVAQQNIALLVDVLTIPLLIGLAITSQLVLSRLANAQNNIASGNPVQTGWTPAMMPPQKPFSTWGGD